MTQESRLSQLEEAAATRLPRDTRGLPIEELTDEELFSDGVRAHIIAAGLPAVNSFDELTDEQADQFAEFIGFDPDRKELELPCPSKLVKHEIIRCHYWHDKVRRGEMTREDYERQVLELAGLPPAGALDCSRNCSARGPDPANTGK